MVTAGIDVGHRTSKLVLLKDGDIISNRVVENSDESTVIVERVLNASLKETDILLENIDFTVATGAMAPTQFGPQHAVIIIIGGVDQRHAVLAGANRQGLILIHISKQAAIAKNRNLSARRSNQPQADI